MWGVLTILYVERSEHHRQHLIVSKNENELASIVGFGMIEMIASCK